MTKRCSFANAVLALTLPVTTLSVASLLVASCVTVAKNAPEQNDDGGSGSPSVTGSLPDTVTIHGFVKDSQEALVANAQISERAAALTSTDTNGLFFTDAEPTNGSVVLTFDAPDYAPQVVRIAIKPGVTTYGVPVLMRRLRFISIAPGDTEAEVFIGDGTTSAEIRFVEPMADPATLGFVSIPPADGPGELRFIDSQPDESLQSGGMIWLALEDETGTEIPMPDSTITVDLTDVQDVGGAQDWQGMVLDPDEALWSDPQDPLMSTDPALTFPLPGNGFWNPGRLYSTACVKGTVLQSDGGARCGGSQVIATGTSQSGVVSSDSIGADGSFCVTGSRGMATTLSFGEFTVPATMPSNAGSCEKLANCADLGEIAIPQEGCDPVGQRIAQIAAASADAGAEAGVDSGTGIAKTDSGTSIGDCTAVSCDDSDPCTDDTCAQGVCSHQNNTASCDDGDDCTVNDTCAAGACVGAAVVCNDSNACTDDTCDSVIGCQYANNTAACATDNNTCTDDICAAGSCTHPANASCECLVPSDCDDSEPCTDDTCDLGVCNNQNNTGPCASDGNACTDDICAAGGCTHPNNTGVCTSDGNPCTDDICAAGSCGHPNNTAVCATDNDPCTDDICAAGSCGHPNNTAVCATDNDACTDDICAAGICAHPDNGTCGVCSGSVCTADYPCQALPAPSVDYTCRGQFADWIPSDSPSTFTDNLDGTVSDSRSGLLWQQTVDAGSYTWDNAQTYCTGLGTGWRLPTLAELESIVDFTVYNPNINAAAFPSTPAAYFWSSSAYVGAAGSAWYVRFSSGYLDYNSTGVASRVRCVWSSTPVFASTGSGGAPPGRYTDNLDGTVLDTLTQLTWQQTVPAAPVAAGCSGATCTQAGAQTYCTGLSLAGTGWRLPVVSELFTIVDPTQYNPEIDATAFPGTPATGFWSLSPVAGLAGNAWLVHFGLGSHNGIQSTGSAYRVRCVR